MNLWSTRMRSKVVEIYDIYRQAMWFNMGCLHQAIFIIGPYDLGLHLFDGSMVELC